MALARFHQTSLGEPGVRSGAILLQKDFQHRRQQH